MDWDDALGDVVRFYTADPFGNRLRSRPPGCRLSVRDAGTESGTSDVFASFS